MRWLPGLCLILLAGIGRAATAYVTDELVLGVYGDADQKGQRLAILHSGTSVETLASSGDVTQVRLADGRTGWVKTAFLVTAEPATVRVKQLEEQLDRLHATTPELAQAALRSEVQRLTGALAAATAELETARSAAASPNSGANSGASTGAISGINARTTVDGKAFGDRALRRPWLTGVLLLLALGTGCWLGYGALALRLRRKFGGVKVY